MTGEGSSSKPFSSFWHRSKDKASPTKVRFMPNVTNPQNDAPVEDPAAAQAAAKKHRRAQVRRAQLEHRQRKANYVKHLEQDVIDLRESIASTATQADLVKHENDAIKKALSQTNITIPGPGRGQQQQDMPASNFQPRAQQEGQYQDLTDSLLDPMQDLQWLSGSSPTSLISINFDEDINASCLHMDPLNTYNPSPEGLNSSDIFGSFSPNARPSNPSQAKTATATSRTKPHIKDEKQLLSTMAINFVLALEHPCRTHFHPHPTTFNPTGPPSGHELMASTLLYCSAPPPIFSNPDSTSTAWEGTSVTLESLYALSLSLPKGDFELTPVQAWFLLAERFGARRLLRDVRVLEGLKRGLGALVRCFEFGAVIEEGGFREVVEGVLGEVEKENEADVNVEADGGAGWI